MSPAFQIVPTPGRSGFDAVRWRCLHGGGDSCGVWRSAIDRSAAVAALNVHAYAAHGVADRRNLRPGLVPA